MTIKNLFTIASVTCAAALAPTTLLHAQTAGTTILNYQLAPGEPSVGDGIVADASGNWFSGGSAADVNGVYHGLVLDASSAQDSTWYLSGDTDPDASQYQSYVWDLGLDANGNLYSIGQLTPNSTGVPYWYVRKSSDDGSTWSTVDQYQYAAGHYVDARGFAADNAGNIYVVGWGRDAGAKRNPEGNIHWLVKQSSDEGATWSVVDDLPGPSASTAAFVSGAGVFVGGDPYAGSSSSWLVRRSPSGPNIGQMGTWETVDGLPRGAVSGIASDFEGNIYAVGQMFVQTGVEKIRGQTIPTGYYAWTTRMSNDRGNTWTTVDSFTYDASEQSSWAAAAGTDPAGNVVVVGFASDAQGARHWIVRSPDGSGAWQTVDDFQLASGYSATALGVVTDGAGNLLVTGDAQDANGFHWIVRRY